MNDQKIEYAIQKAVLHQVPDQLEQLQNTPVAPLQEPDFIVRQELPKRHFAPLKKGLVAICLLLIAVFGLGKLYVLYKTPVAVLSIDLNPSIQLTISQKGTVLTATGCNEDGAVLLASLDLEGRPVDEAVFSLANCLIKNGFFTEENSALLFSFIAQNEADFSFDEDDLFSAFRATLIQNQVSCRLFYQETEVPSLRRTLKQDATVSVGKQVLAEELAKQSGLPEQAWTDMTLDELLQQAQTLQLDLDDLLEYESSALQTPDATTMPTPLDSSSVSQPSTQTEEQTPAVQTPATSPSQTQTQSGNQYQYHGNHWDDHDDDDDDDDDDFEDDDDDDDDDKN